MRGFGVLGGFCGLDVVLLFRVSGFRFAWGRILDFGIFKLLCFLGCVYLLVCGGFEVCAV